MLKRLVKEATGGFSSSGEQSARRKKPTTRRSAASSSSGDERGNERKGKRKEDSDGPKSSRRKQSSSRDDTGDDGGASRRKKPSKKPADDTPTEDEPSSARRKKNVKNEDTRRKKASRMKREPLLEYSVIETVHSAMHGKKKKRARQELLELFGSYDTDDTGAVDAEKFKKCIAKVGIKLKRSSDVDALVRCFTKAGGGAGGDDEDESSDANAKSKAKAQVDYVGFVDFACNVRDSEKLSAVAVKLRDTIRAYDDKHDRATTVPYNISSDLKKLDKNKRGWIASDRFSDFMQDHERPTFRLLQKDIELLTERFEYEYDKGTLGFDYVQFARWLQPMLHLDKKELHARVKQLIQAAQESGGWELAELFEAMDESADGHVSASELKRGMFDMGLPLTDTQIQCLVEEYDIDGDGKIQYNEFVSLFEAPRKKRKPHQQESGDGSDLGRKKRPQSKANVRNTFSWAINKAFARKHAAQASKQGHSPNKTRRQNNGSSSSESERKTRRVNRNAGKEEVNDSDSASEEEKPRRSRLKSERVSSKKAKVTSDDSASTDTRRTGKASNRSKRGVVTSKKRASESLTESDADLKNRKHRQKRTASSSEESSHSDTRQGHKRHGGVKDRNADALKRKSRHQSATSTRSRRESRGRSRSTRRHSQSRKTRASAQRAHSSHLHRSHSRTATLRSRTNRKRAQSAGSKKDGRSASESDDHSAGSESGLDLDQVRKLQNQPRHKLRRGNQSGSEEDEYTDSGDASGEDKADETSKSDREYYKLLKTSLRRAFDFFDTKHTETISKKNIGHVLRALGHEYSSRDLDREIHRADLDKNGEMDFHEFYQLVKRQLMLKAYLLSRRREMEIRQAFQSVDASKGGCVDENEFEFLVYKVLQVELSVEEQDALLDAVENGGDGVIHEEEFIGFMKTLEGFHKNGVISRRRQSEMLESLDPISRLACSAVKKLIRGAPMDLDKNLLMLLGVPTNYRQALTSADVCRDLHEVSMEHALGFPCPETIVGLAQDPIRVSAKKESSILGLGKSSGGDLDDDEAKMVLKQAESWQAHAIVSLKRATGVPKPFDTREEDVIKRSVHVALYQEQDDPSSKKRRHHAKTPSTEAQPSHPSGGMIVGNVHEIPVYWNPSTEDVWEFSRKSTKEDKYKFVVRTNNVNDRLYLLVEFIVHLRTASKLPKRRKRSLLRLSDKSTEVRELAACWCKIPIRTLLAQRLDIYRTKEKLWGGTIDSPIDIEQDEILRRRTGWRAITNAFTKPTPPSMGIKSVPILTYPEEIQAYVRKMPPLIIAPFVSLPIVAEYMIIMQSSMWLKQHSMTGTLCEPVLTLLPKIIDDHEALSVFRRAFDSELSGVKNQEDRQKKFQELVLRMWPSFLDLLEKMPQATLQDAKTASTSIRRLSLLSPTGNTASQLPPAKGTTNETPSDHLARFDLLQCSAQGKLRLRNVPVAAAPFHVREVTFERLI